MRYISNIDNIKRRLGEGQRNEHWGISLLIVVLGLGLLFLTAERMLWSRLNYELARGKGLQKKLQQVNQHLRLERASLEDPTRLARKARKLGLVPPQEGQVVPVETR